MSELIGNHSFYSFIVIPTSQPLKESKRHRTKWEFTFKLMWSLIKPNSPGLKSKWKMYCSAHGICSMNTLTLQR